MVLSLIIDHLGSKGLLEWQPLSSIRCDKMAKCITDEHISLSDYVNFRRRRPNWSLSHCGTSVDTLNPLWSNWLMKLLTDRAGVFFPVMIWCLNRLNSKSGWRGTSPPRHPDVLTDVNIDGSRFGRFQKFAPRGFSAWPPRQFTVCLHERTQTGGMILTCRRC